MNDAIHKKVEELAPFISLMRRDLHKHPEAAWTEFRTASIVAKRLTELGYTLTMGKDAISKEAMMGVPSPDVLKKHQERAIEQGADPKFVARMDGGLTGMWADLQCGGGPGPKFALRFDLDSNDAVECELPEHKPAREGFASVNKGAMHACGHDGHVAVGLAVAEILVGMKDRLKGSIRLIFQPAEEGVRGAGPMVEAGCCKDVDLIVGAHIGFQAAKKGDIVCGARGFLATTKWDVRITGKSAHAGAAPQEGRNALLAACAATTNLHAIARHGDGTTRITVGRLEGGQGRNVIPPNAFMALETRGMTSDLDDYMTTEAARIIKAAVEMWHCTHEIEVMGGTKSGASSPEMIAKVMALAQTMPAFTNIMDEKDFGASEDYSHMMTVVQQRGGLGTYIQVGTNKTAGHHNDRFDFEEDDLLPMAEILVRVVDAYLAK
ncbi:Indole-3-acetyl-aspartic acid hydrolase [uncultured delta proteobacterium]|uniref:Indole-3-acetyl-aspartic acid hydrolase n=1 Tax=uncultured delta proteobacterium TaxID=34034 RepID=A0A212JE54_9DELT|nr:Indole-3-acetyl-aspartic acid hydrolase [uncultured delta proteobacterium]